MSAANAIVIRTTDEDMELRTSALGRCLRGAQLDRLRTGVHGLPRFVAGHLGNHSDPQPTVRRLAGAAGRDAHVERQQPEKE